MYASSLQTLSTFFKYFPGIVLQCFVAALEWILPENWYAKDVSQDIVLITGAGSGLGRDLALEYAKQGSCTIIWDINRQSLDETKKLIENAYKKNEVFGQKKCLSYIVDVSNKSKIQEAAQVVHHDLNKDHALPEGCTERYVSVLVNNAGIYYGRLLSELSDDQIEKIFDINILSHFWTIRAFLPQMIKNKRGHIVEVASMAGISGCHKQVDYCATKFATVGLEEALHYELDHLGVGKKVRTTVICPFFFSSNLFTNYNERAKALMDCQYVAKQTIFAMRCNFNRLLLPIGFGYFSFLLKNVLPREAQILSAKAFGLSECVKDIKGRAATPIATAS